MLHHGVHHRQDRDRAERGEEAPEEMLLGMLCDAVHASAYRRLIRGVEWRG